MRRNLTWLQVGLLIALTGCGPADNTEYPDTLAAWQLMSVRQSPDDVRILELAGDVVPYELATPLFSDYAQKLRTIRFPDAPVSYRQYDPLEFPEGTVISKTFYYPRDPDGKLRLTAATGVGFTGRSLDLEQVTLIETRLLVRERDGWTALPYVWNDEQNGATLQIQGDVRRLTGIDDAGTRHDFHYLVPNRNECGGCHITDETSGQLEPIGPTVRQLNRTFSHYPTGPANQLQTWQERGWLTGLPDDHEAIPSVPRWNPAATDRPGERARAWLDINCGHCHQPGGSADNSGLYLHAAETSPTRLGHCKPPVAAGRGTGGHRYSLQPGAADRSILYHRIASTEPDVMMPELGRSLVQQEAVSLIGQWIDDLPGTCP